MNYPDDSPSQALLRPIFRGGGWGGKLGGWFLWQPAFVTHLSPRPTTPNLSTGQLGSKAQPFSSENSFPSLGPRGLMEASHRRNTLGLSEMSQKLIYLDPLSPKPLPQGPKDCLWRRPFKLSPFWGIHAILFSYDKMQRGQLCKPKPWALLPGL